MKNTELQLTGTAIGIAGFGLLVWQVGWIAGLGMFLSLWGNNLERKYRKNPKTL